VLLCRRSAALPRRAGRRRDSFWSSATSDDRQNLRHVSQIADPFRHSVMSSEMVRRKEMIMTARLNPFAAAPAPMQLWLDFGKAIPRSGLEECLIELVKIRAYA
jgi:hypothetical protein